MIWLGALAWALGSVLFGLVLGAAIKRADREDAKQRWDSIVVGFDGSKSDDGVVVRCVCGCGRPAPRGWDGMHGGG